MNIRPATENDFPAIFALVKGLAVFQNMPEKVLNSVEQMNEEKDLFKCFVAETDDHQIVGIASYFFAYYTWVGKSLYLDDLYVLEEYRGQKIGSKLLNAIFEAARNENCKRVRWQVSDWNTSAIEFYKKCGAEIDHEPCNCDFNPEQISSFRLAD